MKCILNGVIILGIITWSLMAIYLVFDSSYNLSTFNQFMGCVSVIVFFFHILYEKRQDSKSALNSKK